MSALAKPNLFRRAGNRLVEYAKNLANDYRTVLVETAQEARARPLKTVGVGGLLAFLGYAAKTNPDQRELDATLCSLRQRMALLPVSIHSTKASTFVLAARSTLVHFGSLCLSWVGELVIYYRLHNECLNTKFLTSVL